MGVGGQYVFTLCFFLFSGGGFLRPVQLFHEERVSRKRTWEEAEQFCQALGGHLASVSHVEEMKALHALLRNSVRSGSWRPLTSAEQGRSQAVRVASSH